MGSERQRHLMWTSAFYMHECTKEGRAQREVLRPLGAQAAKGDGEPGLGVLLLLLFLLSTTVEVVLCPPHTCTCTDMCTSIHNTYAQTDMKQSLLVGVEVWTKI